MFAIIQQRPECIIIIRRSAVITFAVQATCILFWAFSSPLLPLSRSLWLMQKWFLLLNQNI